MQHIKLCSFECVYVFILFQMTGGQNVSSLSRLCQNMLLNFSRYIHISDVTNMRQNSVIALELRIFIFCIFILGVGITIRTYATPNLKVCQVKFFILQNIFLNSILFCCGFIKIMKIKFFLNT